MIIKKFYLDWEGENSWLRGGPKGKIFAIGVPFNYHRMVKIRVSRGRIDIKNGKVLDVEDVKSSEEINFESKNLYPIDPSTGGLLIPRFPGPGGVAL